MSRPAAHSVPRFSQLAPALLANGYRPVPIKPGTKYPPLPRWEAFEATPTEIAKWRSCYTGILLGEVVAVDIDVLHEPAAEELYQLTLAMLGHGVVRIGQAPKLGMLFRASNPFSKRSTEKYLIEGYAKTAQVEILASGQQVVGWAIHPETGFPYLWPDGTLLDVRCCDLVEVTEAKVDAFLRAAGDVLARYGDRVREAPARQHSADTPPQRGSVPGNGHRDARRQKYVEAAIQGECDAVAATPPGGRNERLNIAAFKLGQFIPGGWLDRRRAEGLLEQAASSLAETDGVKAVRDTIRSGLLGGMVSPRDPPADQQPRNGNGHGEPTAHYGSGEDVAPAAAPALWVDASEIAPTNVEFLWPGRFILNRINVIAGMGDVGKDVFCSTVAACVTTGRDWPDGAPGRGVPGRVGIVSPEDEAADTIIPRLMAAGADLSKVRIWSRKHSPSPDDISGLDLLIVSPLITLMGKDQQMNAEQDVRTFLELWQSSLSEKKVTVVATAHLSKKNDVSVVQRIMGSSAFANFVRSNWSIQRDDEDKTERLFMRLKANLSSDDVEGLKFRIEHIGPWAQSIVCVWCGKTDKAPDEVMTAANGANGKKSASRWLEGFIRSKGGMVQATVAIEAGVKEGFDEEAIKKARARDKRITAEKSGFTGGSWWWKIPEDGE